MQLVVIFVLGATLARLGASVWLLAVFAACVWWVQTFSSARRASLAEFESKRAEREAESKLRDLIASKGIKHPVSVERSVEI